jgi:hypothetical protein
VEFAVREFDAWRASMQAQKAGQEYGR